MKLKEVVRPKGFGSYSASDPLCRTCRGFVTGKPNCPANAIRNNPDLLEMDVAEALKHMDPANGSTRKLMVDAGLAKEPVGVAFSLLAEIAKIPSNDQVEVEVSRDTVSHPDNIEETYALEDKMHEHALAPVVHHGDTSIMQARFGDTLAQWRVVESIRQELHVMGYVLREHAKELESMAKVTPGASLVADCMALLANHVDKSMNSFGIVSGHLRTLADRQRQGGSNAAH